MIQAAYTAAFFFEGHMTAIENLARIEEGLSFTEVMQKDEWEHRKKISSDVIGAFKLINIIIIIIVSSVFLIETALVFYQIPRYERIVDSRTIMTLIGATTVQLGAISIAISNWLFPKKSK